MSTSKSVVAFSRPFSVRAHCSFAYSARASLTVGIPRNRRLSTAQRDRYRRFSPWRFRPRARALSPAAALPFRSHRPDGATITAGGARCDRGASNSGGSIRRQHPRLRCHIEQKLSERRRAERRPGDREGGTRCHPPSPRRSAETTASRRRTCCRPAVPCRPYPSRSWCVSCRRGQRQWSARWSACRRAWRRSGLCSCRRA